MTTPGIVFPQQDHCPDCAVSIDEEHVDGCDVARCIVTGLQQLSCLHDHDCGIDVWTGRWPGDADCERLGLMIGPGLPDVCRLYLEATWDPASRQWIVPT
ncbi:hypothetical protein SAMN04488074_13725 [Lentzea albidocapillata subsp. violacea]|uniref:Uncharacterized protein n=1 Tax=Lentzea albidocapillata subsp. violacea TaxID=128104 RepID=A0A1G9Z736_9PSEU|nr:hypothetical protein [Lentzea albidocapillata]SDN16336.1 hypothetical protein SAMN04488074_13725 [Lentzea albidocapillata subsp. violacea]